MRPAREPLPALPAILMDDDRRAVPDDGLAPAALPGTGVADEPPEGWGDGIAVAVNVADVARGAVTTPYEPTWVGVYEPVPDPPASTVMVKLLIEESGAVTWTVCVEWALNPLSVMVLGAPTVTDDAVVLGEPGGDDVDAAPQRSDPDSPITFTAWTEKVCHADELSPVAV